MEWLFFQSQSHRPTDSQSYLFHMNSCNLEFHLSSEIVEEEELASPANSTLSWASKFALFIKNDMHQAYKFYFCSHLEIFHYLILKNENFKLSPHLEEINNSLV